MRNICLAIVVLLAATGCLEMHENDRQVIGSGEADFPLDRTATLYAYVSIKHGLTENRAAVLSGTEVQQVLSAGYAAATDKSEAVAIDVKRVGHCYQIDSDYHAFAHVEGSLYIASVGKTCGDAGERGEYEITPMYVTNDRIAIAYMGGSTDILKKRFATWARGLNRAQRFWYDIDILEDGKISVSDVDAYIAFIESQESEKLTEMPDFYYSTVPPNAEQMRASQLLAVADARIEARKAAEEAAKAAAAQRQQYARSRPTRVAGLSPGDVVVMDTGWGMAGWVDVQVVEFRQQYPQIKVRHLDNGRVEWVSPKRLKTADQVRLAKTKAGFAVLCIFANDPKRCMDEIGAIN